MGKLKILLIRNLLTLLCNTITGSDDKKTREQRGKTSLWGLISFPMTTSKTTSKYVIVHFYIIEYLFLWKGRDSG